MPKYEITKDFQLYRPVNLEQLDEAQTKTWQQIAGMWEEFLFSGEALKTLTYKIGDTTTTRHQVQLNRFSYQAFGARVLELSFWCYGQRIHARLDLSVVKITSIEIYGEAAESVDLTKWVEK